MSAPMVVLIALILAEPVGAAELRQGGKGVAPSPPFGRSMEIIQIDQNAYHSYREIVYLFPLMEGKKAVPCLSPLDSPPDRI